MGSLICVNTGSDSGFMPDGTKPFSWSTIATFEDIMSKHNCLIKRSIHINAFHVIWFPNVWLSTGHNWFKWSLDDKKQTIICTMEDQLNTYTLQWWHKSAMASQITSMSTLFSTVCSSWYQRKYHSSPLLSLCEGNPPVTGGFLYKGPIMQEA